MSFPVKNDHPMSFREDDTTFEEYFQENIRSNPTMTEYRLVVQEVGKNKIKIYIHPFNKNGKSLDFEVSSNSLKCVTKHAID
jgi:CHASE1-domain containing sensor protein